jgi:hypothetical protein
MPVLATTAYLPSISYLLGCLHPQDLIIEQFETYRKQTCRNHCVIYGPNGKQTLSIPVLKVNGNHTLTKDIRISYSSPWQRIHWRSIETAYNNSPFFLYYRDLFEPFFEKETVSLIDWNMQLLQVIFGIIRVKKNILLTENFEREPEGVLDLRAQFTAKQPAGKVRWEPYIQVFSPKYGFIPDLSVLDLIFNLGPEAAGYLENALRTNK